MIIAHIPTLSGAAWNEFTLIKQNRMTEIATQNRLPLIALVQSVHPHLSSPSEYRPEYSFLSNSKYFIKLEKYLKISHNGQHLELHLAPLCLVPQQPEGHTNQVSSRYNTKFTG
jgi:hypothetical protein